MGTSRSSLNSSLLHLDIMRYQSKAYKITQLIFASAFVGSSFLLTKSQLPLLSKLHAEDILWVFMGLTTIGFLDSLARIKFHAFIVRGISLSLPMFYFSWYFRPNQVIDRINQLTDSHHWILWRQNLSFERYAVSWFFAIEGLIILTYSIFVWRMKTKECEFH